MPLPESAGVGTVTGEFVVGPSGAADSGILTFTHWPDHVSAEGTTITVPPVQVTLDEDGRFSVELLATDDPDVTPGGRAYRVTFALASGPRRSVWMAVLQGVTSAFEDVVARSAGPLVNMIRGPAGMANFQVVTTPPTLEDMEPGVWYVVAP